MSEEEKIYTLTCDKCNKDKKKHLIKSGQQWICTECLYGDKKTNNSNRTR